MKLRYAMVMLAVIGGLVWGWANGSMAQAPAPAAGKSAAGKSAAAAFGQTAPQSKAATPEERLQGAWKNLKYLHQVGGFTMYPIDALLILGIAFSLERVCRMRRKKVLPVSLLKEVLAAMEKGDFKSAVAACRRRKKNTLSRVIIYLDSDESKGASADEIDAAVNEMASRDIDVHRMMFFPLGPIATLSPLLGLLGTVIGIRECFRDVCLAGEMGNPAMLAGGIEKALITTIYGLIVAIIVLFFYNIFKFRLNFLANELEEVLSSILRRHAALKGIAR